MRFLIKTAISVVFLACTERPECPPCEEKAQATVEIGADGGLVETDAGVSPAGSGKQPTEVTSYPLHGRAGFDKVNIWEKPDMDSPRLGYMRKGQRTMLGDPKFTSESCPKGWYKLPRGGFVCQGRGMLVGLKPRYIHRPPPPPRVDELDPYRHGFIRKDWTPVYSRIPAQEEIWSPPMTEPQEGEDAQDGGTFEARVRPPCDPDEEKKEEEEGEAAQAKPSVSETDENGEDEIPCSDYRRYAKINYKAVRDFMSRGFWTSVSNRLRDDDTRQYYYETIKGSYVPGNAVHLIRPPTFRGYEVLGDSPLPGVIVRSRNASFFQLRNSKFLGIGPADSLSVYRVLSQSEGKGIKFYEIEGNRWLKSNQVEYFSMREIPNGVGPNDKWIFIDLSRQSLVAYDGTMPVYATLISSGLAGNEETETPTGKFKIEFKHLTDDMTGFIGDNEDVYSVSDVPWVQYIHKNIALHASFWHSRYGTPKSHGCINLAPADARFLFNWSDPPLPDTWYAVAMPQKGPFTWVIIEGKTPK